MRLFLLLGRTGTAGIAPVIIHFLVQLLLRLARSTVDISTVLTTLSSATTTTVGGPASRRSLPGHVSVDVIRRRFGDIAAAVAACATASTTTSATTTAVGTVACASGAETASIAATAGRLHAVEEATLGPLDVVKRVPVSSAAAATTAGHDGQSDRLALGICAVEFIDRGPRVAVAAVGDVGNAFGAACSVVDERKIADRSDARE